MLFICLHPGCFTHLQNKHRGRDDAPRVFTHCTHSSVVTTKISFAMMQHTVEYKVIGTLYAHDCNWWKSIELHDGVHWALCCSNYSMLSKRQYTGSFCLPQAHSDSKHTARQCSRTKLSQS